MKKILLFTFALMLTASLTFAQFGTAPDFTVTDIDGVEHNLYSILDDGKVVIFDVSATWCGPCWTVHEAHYLRDLNTMYGPEGTDQIRVIFYEADPDTNDADLHGTGSNTLGDWVTGTNYPIIDENPITINQNIYAPEGYPTINVIRPSDREIVADVWNQDLQGMTDAINTVITLGTTSSDDVNAPSIDMTLFPNPVSEKFFVNFENVSTGDITLEVRNVLGQLVKQQTTSAYENNVALEVADLSAGEYFLRLQSDSGEVATKKFVKF